MILLKVDIFSLNFSRISTSIALHETHGISQLSDYDFGHFAPMIWFRWIYSAPLRRVCYLLEIQIFFRMNVLFQKPNMMIDRSWFEFCEQADWLWNPIFLKVKKLKENWISYLMRGFRDIKSWIHCEAFKTHSFFVDEQVNSD